MKFYLKYHTFQLVDPELQVSVPQCFKVNFRRKITVINDCFDLINIDHPNCMKSDLVLLQTSPYHKIFDWYFTTRLNLFYLTKMRSSGQRITENSNFLIKINHDSYTGLNISETLGTYGAELLIPSFTRGKKTVEPLVC